MHHANVRQMVLERLSSADSPIHAQSARILSNNTLTREQKFESLLKIMYQDRDLHSEIKRELSDIVAKELEDEMRINCTEAMERLEDERGQSQFTKHAHGMMHSFQKEKLHPLQEKVQRTEQVVVSGDGGDTTSDWMEANEEQGEDTGTHVPVQHVESDELANVAKNIDVALFEKANRVDPAYVEQLKNAGDRITVPILGHLGLLHEKDVVKCSVDGKETTGRISRDNRIRWTDPETQYWQKFDTVAHFVGHVYTNMEPRSKIPGQFDGWSQCTLVRDGISGVNKEIPLTSILRKAIEKLHRYALDDRLEQEKVTAFPSFENKKALQRKGSSIEKHFEQVEKVISEKNAAEAVSGAAPQQLEESSEPPKKKRRIEEDIEEEEI